MLARIGAAALATVLGVTPALAQERAPWRFHVTPYVWMLGMDATVKPQRHLPTVHVDKSFGDILKDLDGAVFLTGSARQGRFVLLADASWAQLSERARRTLAPGVDLSGKLRTRQTQVMLAAGYTVIEQPSVALDLVAGARAWWQRAEVEARLLQLGRSVTTTESWLDPIFGARVRVDLAPNWSIIGYGDFGGFGVGSRFTWQAVGTINYQFSDQIFVSAGYRHSSVDYRHSGKRLEFEMSGPIVGLTWRF